MSEQSVAEPAGRRRPSRTARRVRDHVALGSVSVAGGLALFAAIESDDAVFRASLASAYVALALFAITVALGPVAAMRGRRYPVSSDLRRDFGIWSGIVALGHVIVGLQVHMRGKMWEYFVQPAEGTSLPRIDPFGAANYTGLVAALILVALLATSNDASLRRLGTPRWRHVHALTTWALILTLLHGAVYQYLEKRTWAYVVLLATVSVALLCLRLVRARAARRQHEGSSPNSDRGEVLVRSIPPGTRETRTS